MFWDWFKRKKSNTNGQYRYGNKHLIELRRVVKTFQTAAGEFTVLKGVDVAVDGGEFVAVVGKSGSGKSTLVNMITGIDRPTSGEVLVGDTAVHTLNESKMAVWRGLNLGIIFQFFQLLPTLSLVENVMLPMDFCNKYTPGERKKRAIELLKQVDMEEHAHKLPSAVSGGQAQRVAIARALANDPPILIADEPTGSLDSKTANAVFALFEKMASEGKTIVMVTHDNDLARRATRAIIVVDGQVTNQYVSKALPDLNVDQMTWVARQLERQIHEPGSTIVSLGEQANRFYIITRGQVDVYLPHPDGQEILVDQLGAGKYFGEVGLLQEGTRTATIRASSEEEVELATLSRDSFCQLLRESDETKHVLDHIVQERAARTSVGMAEPDEATNEATKSPDGTPDQAELIEAEEAKQAEETETT
jgi:ABC-type lipoprotein export system ATPase subunit